MCQIRARLVGALQKAQKRLPGRSGAAHLVIHQQKFLQLWMIKRSRRSHRLFGKTGRFRRGISIERRTFDVAATRPESRADHLVRVGFTRDRISSDAFRSPPPGEPRHTEIETPPEQMHRAVLSDEAGAEFLKD